MEKERRFIFHNYIYYRMEVVCYKERTYLTFTNIFQIHLAEDGKINIYSRNQENNTSKYPDIIGRLKNTQGEEVKSCILDCEAVAWDNENKQILPFQILSTRKRKVCKMYKKLL